MLRWKSKGEREDAAHEAQQAATNAAAPSSDPEQAAQNLPQLLVSEGQISEDQVAAAVQKQRQTGQFIGEILIEEGLIEEHSLISFLAKHCKIPHLSLLDYLIDKEIVELVPKEICLEHRLLPIDKLGRNLTVAMVNPLDTVALAKVKSVCPDLRIKPILCAYKHFEMVTQKVFDVKPEGAADLSASSFGLKLTPEEKKRAQERAAQQAAPAAPPPEPESTPAPEPPAPQPAPEPEPEPEPMPEPEPTPPEPEPVVDVETEQSRDSIFDSIFSSDGDAESGQETPEQPAPAETAPPQTPAPQAPPASTAASSLMAEMASVMMDSMRDTYSVLARRMDLFRDVQAEDVAKIFSRGITREVEAGEIVFQKGDVGDKLYCVLGGSVEIFDGDRVIASLGRGELFGEMALLSEEPRSAGARAVESSSLLALSRDVIHNVMPRDVSVQLLVNIVVKLSTRLREANEQQAG